MIGNYIRLLETLLKFLEMTSYPNSYPKAFNASNPPA